MYGIASDFMSNASTIGWEKSIILLLLSILVYLIYRKFQKVLNQSQVVLSEVTLAIRKLECAATEEDGRVVSQARQLHLIEDLIGDLHTHAEKCLTYHTDLHTAENNIKEIRNDIEQFIGDGKESRANTQRLVENINERLDSFMTLVAGVLRSFVETERRGSGRDK